MLYVQSDRNTTIILINVQEVIDPDLLPSITRNPIDDRWYLISDNQTLEWMIKPFPYKWTMKLLFSDINLSFVVISIIVKSMLYWKYTLRFTVHHTSDIWIRCKIYDMTKDKYVHQWSMTHLSLLHIPNLMFNVDDGLFKVFPRVPAWVWVRRSRLILCLSLGINSRGRRHLRNLGRCASKGIWRTSNLNRAEGGWALFRYPVPSTDTEIRELIRNPNCSWLRCE